LPPALLTEFGNAGVGRAPLAWEFANHVENLPANPVLARGSMSCVRPRSSSARAESMKAHWIPDNDPPDLIGEKVNRIVEELLGTAPERAGLSVRAHSGRSLAVPPNR
jgi:hypothetical protein